LTAAGRGVRETFSGNFGFRTDVEIRCVGHTRKRAKASGQPLVVVLRCVPCLSCMGIDTGVLIENPKLSLLLAQFVRVRVINANKLNLERFQFDYDLSFSTLFLNADGTLYARFGFWEHQKYPENKVTASFAAALEGVLRVHRGYPTNNAQLAGRQGKPTRFKRATNMPGIKGKYKAELNWSGKVVQSCVHCHQLGDSKRFELRELQGKPLPLDLIYPHPPPAVLGLTLDTTAFPLKISTSCSQSGRPTTRKSPCPMRMSRGRCITCRTRVDQSRR